MTAEPQTQAEPTVLEFGRYRVFESPDGGWVIARTASTCETCQACGCGEKQDGISVPGMVIALAKQGGGLSKIKASLKAATGRG